MLYQCKVTIAQLVERRTAVFIYYPRVTGSIFRIAVKSVVHHFRTSQLQAGKCSYSDAKAHSGQRQLFLTSVMYICLKIKEFFMPFLSPQEYHHQLPPCLSSYWTVTKKEFCVPCFLVSVFANTYVLCFWHGLIP